METQADQQKTPADEQQVEFPLLKASTEIQQLEDDASTGCQPTEDGKRRRTGKEQIVKRLLHLLGPQLVVVLLFLGYLLLGALCFRVLDQQFANVPFAELCLLCMETLATIGYGNICPSSPAARLFTMAYALLGIPLCMLTIANLGKHLSKAYGTLARSLRHKRLSRPIGPIRLPMPVLLMLFLICLLGAPALLSSPPHQSTFHWLNLDHLYFAVVSFTTVGFGDLSPKTGGSLLRLAALLVFLSLGMIVLGNWNLLLRDWIQRLFRFKHRQFRHAHAIRVQFGRKQMRLSNLLEAVAREFKASPAQMHLVLRDLDYLISSEAFRPNKEKLSRTEQ